MQLVDSEVSAAIPLELLRCPQTGDQLTVVDGGLATLSGRFYTMTPTGIPLFAEQPATDDARQQMAHYDNLAAAYEANLQYPGMSRLFVEH
jgi:hypothetical protein